MHIYHLHITKPLIELHITIAIRICIYQPYLKTPSRRKYLKMELKLFILQNLLKKELCYVECRIYSTYAVSLFDHRRQHFFYNSSCTNKTPLFVLHKFCLVPNAPTKKILLKTKSNKMIG